MLLMKGYFTFCNCNFSPMARQQTVQNDFIEVTVDASLFKEQNSVNVESGFLDRNLAMITALK